MSRFSLSQKERLKSRKQISLIFQQGKVLKSFPLRFHYQLRSIEESDLNMNIGFVVPKRNCKKAVHRNRYRRRIFEAARLHREALMKKLEEKNLHIDLMIVYIHTKEPKFSFVEKAVIKGFQKIVEQL